MANINVGTILKVNVGQWQNELQTKCYPIAREWQWTRNGVDISGEVSGTYTVQPADIGSQIAVKETCWFLGENNDGETYEKTTSITVVSASHSVLGTSDTTRVYANNLAYLGAFRASGLGISYGGEGLSFNPNGTGGQKTLTLLGGGSGITKAREFTIVPKASLSTSSNITSLPSATGLNPVSTSINDVTEGGYSNSGITGAIPMMRGSQIVPNTSKMLVTGADSYQNGPPFAAVWRRPRDLSASGQVEGPVAIYDADYAPRFNTGWICQVPSTTVNGNDYQTSLGGDMIMGLSGLSINFNYNNVAPSASIFNSADINATLSRQVTGTASTNTSDTITLDTDANNTGTNFYTNDWIYCPSISASAQRITSYNPATRTATISGGSFSTSPSGARTYKIIPRVPCKQLSGRFYTDPLDSSANGFRPIGASITTYGGCIPDGTRSLLIFGVNGDGFETYGVPGEVSDNNSRIWDPANSYKGNHRYPYFGKIWAYDLDELTAVKEGSVSPLAVQPYAIIKLPDPYLSGPSYINPKGVAYDPSTRLLYIASDYPDVYNGGGYGEVIIHVFEVNNAVAV